MTEYLPYSVNINGIDYKIREKCEHRIVLKVIRLLNDVELDEHSKIKCALYNFYQEIYDRINATDDIDETLVDWVISEDCIPFITEMYNIIGQEEEQNSAKRYDDDKPNVMDWEHDYKLIAPAVNRVLGYEIRDPNKYTHWYTFIGAYMEIGDCYFAQVMNIRNKKIKGKKMDEFDREFYQEHMEDVNLPIRLSNDDEKWLYDD